MPADPRPRTRPARPPRRPLAARKAVRPAVPSNLLPALAACLAGSLILAWVLQFATHVCDHHPTLALVLALLNAGLALATAGLAVRDGVQPRAAIAGASIVVLGGLLVGAAQASYRGTLAGAPGYTLPHQPFTYGSGAQEVRLTTADGVSLAATYLGRGRGSGIVLMPGWASGRKGFAIASLAEWLSPRFDVLVVDPRGVGDSDGTLGPQMKAKFDMLAAVAFLNAHGDAQVGAIAERESAPPAIVAATEQHSIKSLALADPSVRWGEAPLQGAWFMDPANLVGRLYWRIGAGVRIAGGQGPETAELLPKVSGVPTLLLGSKDDPQGRLRQLHLVAPEPRSLRLFAGSGDPISWSDFQSYYHTLSEWFDISLTEPDTRVTTEPVAAPETLAAPSASDSISIPMGSGTVTIPVTTDGQATP